MYSKHPNQALKIICSSLVMFIALMFGELGEEKPCDYMSACDSLLKCNENVPFLKQFVKWIHYNNVEWKRSWGKQSAPPPTTPKPGLHPRKVLCIWWGCKGAFHYELLLENQVINSNKCCSQLD